MNRAFSPMKTLVGSVRSRTTISSFNNGLSDFAESTAKVLTVEAYSSTSFSGDLLVLPFYKPMINKDDDEEGKSLSRALKESIPAVLDAELNDMIVQVIDDGLFTADVMTKYQSRVFAGDSSVKNIALVGLGPSPKKEGSSGDLEVASANRLGKSIAAISKEMRASTVGVLLPEGTDSAGLAQLFLGVNDATYADVRYKKEPKGGHKPHPLQKIAIIGVSDKVVNDVKLTYKLASMIGSGVNFARDLVSAPANSKTPVSIANMASQIAKDYNIECKVLDAAECEKLGMGAYLGVQQGSRFPPQFVHMTYKPEGTAGDIKKVALVGKGLTFDSGGYNLKAGAGSMIELMKFDMGGCAAVLGAAKAIAQLRPKNVEVHFITALCENMISAEAMRPGDVLVASNGKTIEVLNTDAEGRLTLADALVYAEKLDVDVVVDLATLTGACIVALGDKMAAMYANNDDLKADLENAAKRSGDKLWNMPLEPMYKDMIKGNIADIKNIGGKGAGSITAALFLQEFIEKDKTKWAHIDMAGPVWIDSKPTGYGVKLLVDFLLNIT